MEDQAPVFLILSVEVDWTLLNQVFDTIKLAISNCVENRSLALSVKVIWVTSRLYEILEYFFVTFSSSIENGCLTITVGVVGLAAIFKEQFD